MMNFEIYFDHNMELRKTVAQLILAALALIYGSYKTEPVCFNYRRLFC